MSTTTQIDLWRRGSYREGVLEVSTSGRQQNIGARRRGNCSWGSFPLPITHFVPAPRHRRSTARVFRLILLPVCGCLLTGTYTRERSLPMGDLGRPVGIVQFRPARRCHHRPPATRKKNIRSIQFDQSGHRVLHAQPWITLDEPQPPIEPAPGTEPCSGLATSTHVVTIPCFCEHGCGC